MEKPIIFNSEMVRAILEGRKTQARIAIKPQPKDMTTQVIHLTDGIRFATEDKPIKCPFGQPGDKLWCRETWAVDDAYDHLSSSQLPIDDVTVFLKSLTPSDKPHDTLNLRGKWRPSIFMPKWASRLQLRIKDVRVERVQDITEADARTEGCVKSNLSMSIGIDRDSTYRENFEKLWNSINEKRGYGWDVNPWVWVVEFERIEK